MLFLFPCGFLVYDLVIFWCNFCFSVCVCPHLQACNLKKVDLGQKMKNQKNTKMAYVFSLDCECDLTIAAVKNNLNEGFPHKRAH